MQILVKILIGIIGFLLLVIIIGFISKLIFNHKVNKEIEKMFDEVSYEEVYISESDISDLPTSVQNWLRYSNVLEQEDIQSAIIKQDIKMRLGSDKPWMNATANQYVTTELPGFIWHVDINMMPLVHISGRDKYIDGKGEMLIKVMSLIKVADSKGSEMDQGSLLRYLAELCWTPSAALKDYITWEEIDETHAKAIMTYKDVSAEGIFEFDNTGKVVSFEALRYGEFDQEFRLETWFVEVGNYQSFSGYNLPTTGDITWKLESGDYHWYSFEVVEVVFNQRA